MAIIKLQSGWVGWFIMWRMIWDILRMGTCDLFQIILTFRNNPITDGTIVEHAHRLLLIVKWNLFCTQTTRRIQTLEITLKKLDSQKQ